MLSSDTLNLHVLPGISLAFALIFFAPLFLISVIFLVYSIVARGSVLRIAKILSVLWLLACIPAGLLIVMGYAFNSSKLNPLLALPLWIGTGLAALWLPVVMRVVLRIRPV